MSRHWGYKEYIIMFQYHQCKDHKIMDEWNMLVICNFSDFEKRLLEKCRKSDKSILFNVPQTNAYPETFWITFYT